MKNLIWLDVSMESSSLLEDIMDNTILKDAPYSSKYKLPNLEYNNILIELFKVIPDDVKYLEFRNQILSHTIVNQYSTNEDILYSIYFAFAPILTKSKSYSFSIHGTLTPDQFGVMYTDGSYSNKVGDAGYACCKLTEANAGGAFDPFNEQKFLYESFSGRIKDGTNNIGELTAIKVAIENFNEKPFQVIVSDSISGIKSYREYIHNSKINGYKAYNKKPIKNKELIVETYEKLKEAQKDKIIMFAWTKGHANNDFNEICDVLAKGEIGI